MSKKRFHFVADSFDLFHVAIEHFAECHHMPICRRNQRIWTNRAHFGFQISTEKLIQTPIICKIRLQSLAHIAVEHPDVKSENWISSKDRNLAFTQPAPGSRYPTQWHTLVKPNFPWWKQLKTIQFSNYITSKQTAMKNLFKNVRFRL